MQRVNVPLDPKFKSDKIILSYLSYFPNDEWSTIIKHLLISGLPIQSSANKLRGFDLQESAQHKPEKKVAVKQPTPVDKSLMSAKEVQTMLNKTDNK